MKDNNPPVKTGGFDFAPSVSYADSFLKEDAF